MDAGNKTARRYHWHSDNLRSFVEEPHTAICGINKGSILNLTAAEANNTKQSMMNIMREKPELIMQEIQQLLMPGHHEVKREDVNLKRLGAVLWLAHEKQPKDFEELLLLQGVGPRTIQSLALVSEVIHGTPSRFKDPLVFRLHMAVKMVIHFLCQQECMMKLFPHCKLLYVNLNSGKLINYRL